MAAIIATANGGQPLTLPYDEGVDRERNGGEREVVGLPNHLLGDEVDEGRSAQRQDYQCAKPRSPATSVCVS